MFWAGRATGSVQCCATLEQWRAPPTDGSRSGCKCPGGSTATTTTRPAVHSGAAFMRAWSLCFRPFRTQFGRAAQTSLRGAVARRKSRARGMQGTLRCAVDPQNPSSTWIPPRPPPQPPPPVKASQRQQYFNALIT